MRQKGLISLYRIEEDIQSTVPAGLSISDTPTVLAGQSLEQFTLTGGHTFLEEVWAYHLVGEELRRTEWEPPGPPALSVTLDTASPSRLPSIDLTTLANSPGIRSLPLTNQVNRLAITHGGVGPAVGGPIAVELDLGTADDNGNRVNFRRVFSPRLGE